MSAKAILKRVVCEEYQEERKTEGGILLPDCHTKDQVQYKLVSKGKDVTNELFIGDIVLVDGFQGHDIKVGEKKYRVFEEAQILAVIDA